MKLDPTTEQFTLLDKGEWWEEPWRGMPEFSQEDLAPYYSVQMDFDTQEDFDRFFALVGQKGPNTQGSIYYPEAAIGRTAGKYYAVDDPSLDPNPTYPVYVISKGRWDTRMTSKALERIHVPYRIVIEPQEYDQYARVMDPSKILKLPRENFNGGMGSIPVRNWVWEHARELGAKRHWIMDDNIEGFFRLNHNLKIPVRDGAIFRVMEEYVDRYTNVAIAGPHYFMFASRKSKLPPFIRNSRVYSCILIRNDVEPMGERWRGRYNEDTDLSIRALKEGYATVLFLAFLAMKATTMTMKGGNTDQLYAGEALDEFGNKYSIGRKLMAESLKAQHPDIVKVTYKWGRHQHHVDYSGFKRNELIYRSDYVIPEGVDNHGMTLHVDDTPRSRAREPELPPLPRAEVLRDNFGPLPSLDGIKSFALDTETSAERDFRTHKLGGISYYLPYGRKGYLPIDHPGGGNFEVENLRAWAKGELRNKELIVANATHEVDTFLRFGINLEEQGCSFRDVFHQAALVNDHRVTIMECENCGETYPAIERMCSNCGGEDGHSLGRVNLDVLARIELGRKLTSIDHTRLYDMPAGTVAPVAIEDAEVTWQLYEYFQPQIEREELQAVLDLEDSLVFTVSEMERNGTYLDVERLKRYDTEVTAEYEKRLITLRDLSGIDVDTGSWKGMQKLFDHLGLDYPYTRGTAKKPDGQPSFPEDFLITVPHPAVVAALEARQLSSHKSKFLDPYLAKVAADGSIRYNLNQLAGDQKGAITGRFSSSGDDFGINVQQVSKNSKQPKLLQRWPIRACFIPGTDDDGWISADASQEEFRIFAHYAAKLGCPRLARAYAENERERACDPRVKLLDFHALVSKWTNIIRDYAKNINFCKLFGGGAEKIAYMINSYRDPSQPIVTVDWVEEYVVAPYDREFPEARWLIGLASRQAKELGFIRTELGRRRRFGEHGERYYSGLNCAIQGTAADINKKKLKELYDARKRLGLTMRFPVHDEVNGGLKDRAMLGEVDKLLNEQTTKLFVPILWECDVKDNWHGAHR